MPETTYDAVVVGAGPNGLVAANRLLDKGWSVLVLEAQPDVGGAVRSDTEVHPGFVHDTFSAFYPLAAASEAIRDFRLEEHGLRWVHAPAVLGHPRPDGSWALLHRDRELTARLMEEAHPGDGEAWLELCGRWDRIGPQLVRSLITPFPPVRHGLATLARLRSAGGLDLVRTLLSPAADLGRTLFGGDGPGLLLAGNAGHADIPLDAAGSGLMGVLMSMLGQTVGFPVPEGGAGRLSQALAHRIRALGGRIECDAEVTRIEVRDGRAVAVRTEHGDRFPVRQAVLADVVASHLYGGLVADADLPRRTLRAMRRFQLDPSTVKVDWALSGPVPWASAPPVAPGTVHVADSVAQMTEALAQVAAGVIPAAPFLLTGQMTTSDPTRSPAGTESMWAYTHVPQQTVRDAGEAGVRGVWDRDDCERFADRMQDRVERLAPGFGSRVLSPAGARPARARGARRQPRRRCHQRRHLAAAPAARAAAGARPGPGGDPVRGLYLASASAHPGGGVHGAPGLSAARAALAHARVRSLTPSRR